MANTYKTVQGDTWDVISLNLYGSEIFTDRLLKANFAQRNVAVFGAGVVLNAPVIAPLEKQRNNLPPWRRNQ